MATIMFASMAMQPFRNFSCERACSWGTIMLTWQSIPLNLSSGGFVKNARRMDFARSSARAPARATVAAYTDVDEERSKKHEKETSTNELLCCPICFNPLNRNGPTGLNQNAIKRSAFSCKHCRRSFSNKDVYVDLTILEGTRIYDENTSLSTEFFRNPLISFVYGRGYRQYLFPFIGFPGADEEFKMAQDYFKPAVGGVLMDVSCGSGLFSCRFARSGDYKAVIALDFSENMLRQSNEFFQQDPLLASSSIALVRADVARLPFATGSIDAVHAGAAIHSWPSPAAGMAEISRILKPGGVFVATTFLATVPILDFGSKDVRKAIKGVINSSTAQYWEEAELEEICGICGLVEYSSVRRRCGLPSDFIMFSARKAE